MTWAIELKEEKGIHYDSITNTLRNEKGYDIATIFLENDGQLFISLGANTNFVYDTGEVAVGWNGDDIHVGEYLRPKCGGVLEYCENRFSSEYYQGIRRGEISIRINKIEGQIVPYKTRRIKRRNVFFKIFGLGIEYSYKPRKMFCKKIVTKRRPYFND